MNYNHINIHLSNQNFSLSLPKLGCKIGGYRFAFNGQEKTDEIAGVGNHNTALFWEYDTRTGRRWNLDPKPTVGLSGYACFENNPIWFSDPNGDKVINAHKESKDKAENRKALAEEKMKKLNKGDDGYRKSKRELRRATNSFNEVNEQYQAVEESIKEMKVNQKELFNEIDNLTAEGKVIDVTVEAHPEKFYANNSDDPVNGTVMDIHNKNARTALGFASPPSKNQGLSPDGNKYYRVGIAIRVQSAYGTTQTIYHEFRHIHYKNGDNTKDIKHGINEEQQVKIGTQIAYPDKK